MDMITDQELKEMMLVSEREAMNFCGYIGHTEYSTIRNRKFAELVVQKCVDSLMYPPSVMKAGEKDLQTLSQFNQGWVSGRLLAAENIRAKFGI